VALEAQGGLCVLQKLAILGRGVGIVAIEAVLRDRIMLVPVAGDPLAERLVALETELTACSQQVHLIVRRMRVVAGDALAFDDDLMDAPRFAGDDVIVALVADVAAFCGK
jgi:hypothetical protein